MAKTDLLEIEKYQMHKGDFCLVAHYKNGAIAWLTESDADEAIRCCKAEPKIVEERDFLKRIVQIDVKVFDLIRDEYSQSKDLQAKLNWRTQQVDKILLQALEEKE